MRPISFAAAAFAAALTLAGIAAAQDVSWEEPGYLGAGQPASLSLVFHDTEPAGRVAPPPVDGLTVLGPPSQQSSVSIVNGARSDSLMLSFPVRAEREGTLTIPSFDIETADGPIAVPALTLEVGAAMLPGQRRGSAPTAIDDVVEARLTPKRMTPYAGEVFDVDATVGLAPGRRGQVVGTPSWSDGDVVAEPWSEGRQVSIGEGAGVHFRTRAVAPQAGRLELSPLEQEVEIEVGRSRVDPFEGFGDAFGSLRKFGGADVFGSLFARPQASAVTVRSNSVQLDVQPLPQPAPAGFSGAVGQFTLDSSIAPAQPKTGDPVTWTLTLAGSGNWNSVALPARAVPNDFRTLQPKQHKQFAAGQLFDGRLSEDLVLVPNQPGDYRLEPVRFTYFDPALGQYQTIEAQPPALHITGAPIAPPQPQAAPAAAAPGAPPSRAAAGTAPVATQAVGSDHTGRLPHDPLPRSATAFAPIAFTHLAQIAALPAILFLAYWLALAVRHARLSDPRRPQRLAFKALAPAIERVRTAASADDRLAALLAWQRTAATALGIDRAAPTAGQLSDQRWAEVWAGSERALYAREHALPGGWCDRALRVATRSRAPRFNPLRALSARHLIPKAATAALLVLCAVAPVRAAEPTEAYAGGDFAAARAEWLARAQQDPSDWIARYNLGLTAAQLGDAPRAAADTLAAFVRQPGNADVRWNASALAAAVPGLDAGAAALLAGNALPTWASPARWQGLAGAGVLLFCGGAAAIVRKRYGAVPRLARRGAAAAIGGVALAATATYSLHAYGPLADPRAALVAGEPLLRSVPTDAEATQQQKPLPAGTLVVVERDFLGWTKVTLRGGETGWLRQGDLVPLYAAPSA